MGIWNCDKPVPKSSSRVMNPVYMINDSLYQQPAYLLDLTRNMVIRQFPGSELRFEKISINILFMIIGDNQLAVFRYEDFKKIGQIEDNYVFELHKVKSRISNYSDFMEAFKSDFR